MAEDQSVVGRRRIYYDQHGSEALICSDSEEEITEPEEEKHEFSEAEDRILWMAFEEHGLNEEVLILLASPLEERYKSIKENNIGRFDQHSEGSGEYESPVGICPEKSLSAALDSFDNLFCRRCLQIFDCRLHGCSQPLIYPREKQTVWSEPEGDRKPCSDQCYLQQLKAVKSLTEDSTPGSYQDKKTTIIEEADGILAPSSAEEPDNQSTALPTEVDCHGYLNLNAPVSENLGKRKVTDQSDTELCDSILPPDDPQNSCKKLKRVSDDVGTVISDYNKNLNLGACDESKHIITCAILEKSVEHASNKLIVSSSTCHGEHDKSVGDGPQDVTNETEIKKLSNSMEGQVDAMLSLSDWKPLEKELYLKGVEMFGRNSCLIARNLLSGLKTCVEIASYMHAGGVSMPHRSLVAPSSIMDDRGKFDGECTDQDMPSRSRLLRKRGKTRKFKYSWKSAGHPSIWKRIADGKNQSCKQYTPCGCQSMCGKDCSCVNGGTCCEKYCGCSKSCKNRFRGCHCAKSQCRSRQCPCFAAGRECDPDVCRNCWVSCGDGSLGEPPRRGEGQCGNMRLLLRQQQRILLAKSDVAGWGAFLKNPVNKNDYLGEYTGELISHREADKRGKIYDRANSSFLFDLNDQACISHHLHFSLNIGCSISSLIDLSFLYVLDAYRKGDKLKFANHSSNPNCYAKVSPEVLVMLVAGDHRVGIFAKEHIDASEELFYDYRYGPDQAPPWARKPEGSKRDESAVPQGRAKKHQSH
ncbi:Tesmin/TSO1-like CXC domain [Sesbania bispinosa]|nr:Tesmin/TSO1-like CXC domain [Sesbania bispinosa]